MTDLAQKEATLLLSRLRSLALVHAAYTTMLIGPMEPAERTFAEGEVARVAKEMKGVAARIQLIAAQPDPSPTIN